MMPEPICHCGHVLDEHDEYRMCTVVGCDCVHFERDLDAQVERNEEVDRLNARIRELEAERDAIQARVDELHGAMRLDPRFSADAIRAKTIEECATVVERMPIQIYGPDSCKPATFDDAAKAIRTLAQMNNKKGI